jgi:glycine/D-amino acid oxidase-like deaminating enzyme
VVVVGAGLVGALVATRLAREGLDTAVLEARTVAGGATGRSAGMVLAGLPGHYDQAISTYGRQRAREIWALTVEGREKLLEQAQRLSVPVEPTGSIAVATDDAEAEALAESAELLQEDGFNVGWEPGDPLERGFSAVLHCPDDATVDAAALTQALLSSSGAPVVHQRTEVHNLERDGDRIRVWAQGRNVLCDAVILAVNSYAPLLDFSFADKVTPTRSLTLITEPLGQVMLEQPCCADHGQTFCRQFPDGRLLVGGWREESHASPSQDSEAGAQEDGFYDALQDKLVSFAARHFPEIRLHKTRHKSGVMDLTPDGLPLVGRLSNLPQVTFAVGLGGRGLAWAAIVAERVVQLVLNAQNPEILDASRLKPPKT